jgi:mannose-1-phosphate guanylyltransferase
MHEHDHAVPSVSLCHSCGVEAILLVGGQGTRLRPLTVNTPKPMLPVAGVTCTEHQIARAREAGITRVILGTSYRSEVFQEALGDGSALGVELIYVVEDQPLGTGGAVRNAARHLTSAAHDPVLVFNGDVLTGLNITRLVDHWRDAAAEVALYLTRVEDPRAYGLVPTDDQGRVTSFLEKPSTPEEIVTDQVNAGCYVFRRDVIDRIPEGRVVSIERETFPQLLAEQCHVIGVVDPGYWLDLGTPLSFVRGSCDLVRGIAPSPVLPGPVGDSLVLHGAQIGQGSFLSGGSTIGRGASIGRDAVIDGSIVMDGAVIEAGAVVRGSIVGVGARVGSGAVLTGAVIGDGAVIGARNELIQGARVWPDVHVSAGAIRFSPDT